MAKALGETRVLGEIDFPWELGRPYALSLEAEGPRLRAAIDGIELFDLCDEQMPLSGGGVALVCEEGCVSSPGVRIGPPSRSVRR